MRCIAIVAYDKDKNPGVLNLVEINSPKDEADARRLWQGWSDFYNPTHEVKMIETDSSTCRPVINDGRFDVEKVA